MSSMKKWSLVVILLVALVALSLAACGPQDTEPESEPEESEEETTEPEEETTEPEELPRLTIAIQSEIQGTDPQQISTTSTGVHHLIFTPPMSLGLENEDILPWGASEVEVSDDGLEWRFTYDPSVEFHNGKPVTAEAAKESIERYNVTGPYLADYESLEEMVVEGDTLIFKMSEPMPGILPVLSSAYGAPIDVEEAEELGEEMFHRKAIGSGPYYVEEWVDGSHILLKRNDEYKDFLPFVDNNGPFHFSEVMVRFIPEPFTRVQEIRAGNVDMIADVPGESLQELQDDPEVDVHEYLNSNTRHMQMNVERFPFTDKAVREAVALALNRDEIAEGVGGIIEPVYGLIGPAMLNHDPEAEERFATQWAHDAEMASEILADAGWEENAEGILEKDGETLTFTLVFSGDNAIDSRAAPIIQNQLSQLGMDVELREYETAYTRELIRESDFDMIIRNWSWLDPGGVWYYGLHSSASLAPWSAPDLDEMLDEVLFIADDQERMDAWTAISERVWEDIPIVPLWSDRLFVATRENVTGLHISVSGDLYYHDMQKSE
ncbi:MAG: ABC transporter substrate-binding protein [Bacillota bacterium]